jgi:hypothetical protein
MATPLIRAQLHLLKNKIQAIPAIARSAYTAGV